MHRPNAGLTLAASLVAMMKGVGSVAAAAAKSTQSVDDFGDALLAAAPHSTAPRYPHRKSAMAFAYQEAGRPSKSYKARQEMRRRYDNGLPVPDDVREAYERHAAERADLARRRAYAARRQVERKVLDRFMEPADTVIQMKALERVQTKPSPGEQNILDKARELYFAWQYRQPFPAWAMEGAL